MDLLTAPFRELLVPDNARGMRLDKFLSLRFSDLSRSALARGVRAGLVCTDAGRPLRASHVVRPGDRLRLYLPEVAPSEPAPPFPELIHDDDRIAVVDKPAGMMAHPAGTQFCWALIGLAKDRWPAHRVDLVHRLDRDTSGLLAITKDLDANAMLKRAVKEGRVTKVYQAIVKGVIPWDEQLIDAPIDEGDGPVRIQMAIRVSGKSARTTVRVLERSDRLTRVECLLHTGRTHQIRLHLAHVGFPLLGDRMYGVPLDIALRALEIAVDQPVFAAAGAPRHALHAWKLTLPHPDGGQVHLERDPPADMASWWDHPDALPWDGRLP